MAHILANIESNTDGCIQTHVICIYMYLYIYMGQWMGVSEIKCGFISVSCAPFVWYIVQTRGSYVKNTKTPTTIITMRKKYMWMEKRKFNFPFEIFFSFITSVRWIRREIIYCAPNTYYQNSVLFSVQKTLFHIKNCINLFMQYILIFVLSHSKWWNNFLGNIVYITLVFVYKKVSSQKKDEIYIILD